jgi:prevent-host-death family protein
MNTINIHEATKHFSRIVEEVAHGKEVVITKAGVPMVKMVPLAAKRPALKYGTLKGKITIANDFDAPFTDDILRAFGIES